MKGLEYCLNSFCKSHEKFSYTSCDCQQLTGSTLQIDFLMKKKSGWGVIETLFIFEVALSALQESRMLLGASLR